MEQRKFFQNERKFIVGKCYEKLRVNRGFLINIPIELSDEQGDIISGSNVYVGEYVRSNNTGWGDNRTRYDYFILDGIENVTVLDYDGTTRFREVDCETRLPVYQEEQNTPIQSAQSSSQNNFLTPPRLSDTDRNNPPEIVRNPYNNEDMARRAVSNHLNDHNRNRNNSNSQSIPAPLNLSASSSRSSRSSRLSEPINIPMPNFDDSDPIKRTKQLETYADRFRCPVCFECEINCVLQPCGHCLCEGCFVNIQKTSNKCSICRTIITGNTIMKLGSYDTSLKKKYLKYKNKYFKLKNNGN